MSGPAIDREVIASHGLTEEEYARVVSILGRSPNLLELGIFSVMWSEHCSYKSSRLHLRTLPTKGPHVLQGPDELPHRCLHCCDSKISISCAGDTKVDNFRFTFVVY